MTTRVESERLHRDAAQLLATAHRARQRGHLGEQGRVPQARQGGPRAVLAGLGGEGDVRSCVGGPAVLGEVVLHTDDLYVCLCVSSDPEPLFYFRTCRGRLDYAGGTNNWYSFEKLAENPTGFVERLRHDERGGAMMCLVVGAICAHHELFLTATRSESSTSGSCGLRL